MPKKHSIRVVVRNSTASESRKDHPVADPGSAYVNHRTSYKSEQPHDDTQACAAFNAAYQTELAQQTAAAAANGQVFDKKCLDMAFTQDYCNKQQAAGKPKHYICSANTNDGKDCATSQEYAPHGITGRNVISHFFGRNKGSKQQIPQQYNVAWCRKDYQHMTYQCRNKPEGFARLQLIAIKRQLELINDWTPNIVYTVQLRKELADKLSKFNELARDVGEKRAARTIDSMRKGKKVSDEELFPVRIAEEVRRLLSAAGGTFTKAGVETLLKTFEGWLDSGKIVRLPMVEFLVPTQDTSRSRKREATVDRYADDSGQRDEAVDGDAESLLARPAKKIKVTPAAAKAKGKAKSKANNSGNVPAPSLNRHKISRSANTPAILSNKGVANGSGKPNSFVKRHAHNTRQTVARSPVADSIPSEKKRRVAKHIDEQNHDSSDSSPVNRMAKKRKTTGIAPQEPAADYNGTTVTTASSESEGRRSAATGHAIGTRQTRRSARFASAVVNRLREIRENDSAFFENYIEN